MLWAGDLEKRESADHSSSYQPSARQWMTASVEAAAAGNVAKADSLALLAIAEAEMRYDETLILEALITLFSLPPSDERTLSLSLHLHRLESLAGKRPGDVLKWQSLHQLSAYYQSRFEFEKALDYAYQALARSEDLLMIELENAERMEAMEAARKAEEIKRRNNIQYTAIIIAIFSLFVLLILLGSVRVPKWSIQALGFFAFIFLFEFIILVADYEIHHLTHGVPWKILAIKVVLIAFLLPFHHWVEKKVVQYLLRKKLIRLSGFSFKRMFQNVWHTVFGH